MKHFNNICDFIEYTGLPKSEHPMFSLVSVDTSGSTLGCPKEVTPAISTDFYSISLKKVVSGELNYGRSKYDFKNGALIFISPDQVIQWNGIEIDQRGFLLTFHKDFFNGTDLKHKIEHYGFFSYSANEALHLSPNEETILESVFENMKTEYENITDEFSKDIIINHLNTFLSYSDRFYKRQFINRSEDISNHLDKINTLLIEQFEDNYFEKNGLPKIADLSNELSISSRYLSDSIKAETGKSITEHIHLFVLDEAKKLLKHSDMSVSEVAYKMGFEYPQYFSRLFKKKEGMSPTLFKEQFSRN